MRTNRSLTITLPVAAGLICLLAITNTAAGQCEVTQLLAVDGAPFDNFGGAVAIQGDTLVVGAREADGRAADEGAVYVYQRVGGTWLFSTKLTASDAQEDAAFGTWVAIDDTLIAVGAMFADGAEPGTGAVYLYQFDGLKWTEEGKLYASDGLEDDRFGNVAIDGDRMLIGAVGVGGVGFSDFIGAAYVFHRDEATGRWAEQAILTASDPSGFSRFGSSVALLGNWAFLGADGHDLQGSSAGAVYFFQYLARDDKWIERGKILPVFGQAWADFGSSIGVSGDTLVVGAGWRDEANLDNVGVAYVFQIDLDTGLWSEEAKLIASDVSQNAFFGDAVAISGDTIVVGAPGAFDDLGSAYVFEYLAEKSQWIEVASLHPDHGNGDEDFGWPIAIDGDTAVAGARFVDDNGTDSGAAFVFDAVSDADHDGNGIADACEGFADLNGDGVVDSSDLLILLGFWGSCPEPPQECLGDLNADGGVDSADLIILLGSWT